MGFPKHLVALLEALYNEQSAVIRWNGRHSSAFKIERGVRQGCILSPHLFNLYTESVIREAGIEEMGIQIGGKLVSNLRYADDTALCANSQEEAERLIGKVNIIGKSRLLKLNVKKTKLLIKLDRCSAMQEFQWVMKKLRWLNISNILAH